MTEVESIRLLQAQIEDAMASIEKVYRQLDKLGLQATNSEQDIVLGYYLHVLYGLFENLFEQIAVEFGNHLADKSQWHSQLLKRMTLDVSSIRPPVISPDTHDCLNELRRFRHLFRNAYLIQFDPERLNIVLRYAGQLRSLYQADLDKFIAFLDELAQTDT